MDFSPARILDNPMQDVIFMFLRHISRVKRSTAKWLLLSEYGMQPVQLHWLRLCVRWWNHAVKDEGLVFNCLKDQMKNIAQGHKECWAYKFLHAMVHLNLLRNVHDINADNLLLHTFNEQAASTAAESIYNQCAFGDALGNPRTCPSQHAHSCRYRRWFWSESSQAHTHINTAMPRQHFYTLIRCRLMNWNIPVNMNHDIPRWERKCHLCHNDIGDEMHYLMHCTACEHIRQSHSQCVAFFHSDMNSFMNGQNVLNFAAYVQDLYTFITT